MAHDPKALAAGQRWSDLGAFLRRELLLVPGDQRASWLGEWEELAVLERDLDDRLAVGLVGGTGVGKSTLINALAGAEISTTGDRRPTTDRVIAYRHERTSLPDSLPRGDLAEPEVVHGRAELERVMVLDFPDFDSVDELHHEILERYLPHLDVLLVVVDDMKYGDFRLFDLLRRVSQSPRNLYMVLNKLDRLEKRYSERTARVVDEILSDLASKLREHARVEVPRESMFAISALLAARDGESSVGEYPRVVALLEGYRQEKRRRAAKELNIEARKSELESRVGTRALEPGRKERARRARELLDSRGAELARVLASTPAAIFTAGERRRMVSETSRGAGARFGFPVDFLLTLARELRRGRSARGGGPGELSAARIRLHYRAYAEGVGNALREARLEAGDLVEVQVPAEGATSIEDPSRQGPGPGGMEAILPERLGGATRRLETRSRLSNHALALAVVLGFLWWLLFPAVRGAAERLFGAGDAGWGDILESLFLRFLGALNPLTLLSLAILVVVSYVLTAAVIWIRHVQRVEAAVSDAEGEVRRRIEENGSRALAGAVASVRRWLGEREELEGILGRRSPA